MKNNKKNNDIGDSNILNLEKNVDMNDTETSDFQMDEVDMADLDTHQEEYNEQDENHKINPFQRINWHIVFVVALIIMVGLVFYRFKTFGVLRDPSLIEGKESLDVLDSIVPLINDSNVEPVDDGITTIVAFGNSPFADDRTSKDNLSNLIANMADATVYNCSVEGSYLASIEETLRPNEVPIDAFNFYWLTTLMCMDKELTKNNYDQAFAALGDSIPEGAREAYETLTTLDFNTVDVITLMYDGSDYLAGHLMYSDENPTDIQHFTGNMEAGIELIRDTFPHIRIIVLSPTYAYAIDENGDYISSDMYRYGQDVLSTYVIKQIASAYTQSVTIVDNLYGTIHEDIASDYLKDNIHLNIEGRKLVAERFVYALNYYND